MARDTGYTSQSRANTAPGSDPTQGALMAGEADLSANLEAMGLPQEARTWLLDLWNLIQVLDDAYDGDRADTGEVLRATRAIFWDMPLNPFYRQYSSALQPLILLMVLKWEAANAMEEAGEADERSYVWRAEYYGVVLMVCHLCGAQNAGMTCLKLYGETFAEYIAEFRGAV